MNYRVVDQGIESRLEKLEKEHVVKGELHHCLGKYERYWVRAYCQAVCVWRGLSST